VVLALGAAGAVLAVCPRRRASGKDHRRSIGVLVLLLVLAWFFSFLPFAIASRYRVPVVPLLLLLAAHFACETSGWIRERRYRRAFLWISGAALLGAGAAVNGAAYHPNFGRWHYQRGISWQVLQQPEKAIPEFKAALEYKPRWAAVTNDLGAALASTGRLAESTSWFRRSVLIDPRDAAVHCNLAWALELQGQDRESLAEYRQASELLPGYDAARRGVQRIESRLSREHVAVR